MRKKLDVPFTGKGRVVKRFALTPIYTKDEMAWFEVVYIYQEYSSWFGWENIRFTDEGEYLMSI